MDKVTQLAKRMKKFASEIQKDHKKGHVSDEFQDGALSTMVIIMDDLEDLFNVDLKEYDFGDWKKGE